MGSRPCPMDAENFQNTIPIDPPSLAADALLAAASSAAPDSAPLKRLFDVTPAYLVRKTLLVLFPFRHASWRRADTPSPAPPRCDTNAPDLYLPLVSLGTFVLLRGFEAGIHGRFHPDVLGLAATYATATLLVLVLFVKIACHLVGFGSETSSLDIAAVLGYNFVNLCLVAAVGLFAPSLPRNIARIYVLASMSFFLARCLLHSSLPAAAHASISQSRRKKINFLLGVVLVNLVFSFFLTRQ